MEDLPLRKNQVGFQKPWTVPELLAGLSHYFALNGRYPSAHEIDSFEFLPSSRTIQRSYGGLQKLRSQLIPYAPNNLTKGTYRSGIAKRTYKNGKRYEEYFFAYLTGVFQDVAVHEHKVIRPGDVSCDFFIYTKQNAGIVIDIFFAESIANLVNIVNIKLRRYQLITPETYLVLVGNSTIAQDAINQKTAKRQTPLPAHIQVVSEAHFKSVVVPGIAQRSDFLKQ